MQFGGQWGADIVCVRAVLAFSLTLALVLCGCGDSPEAGRAERDGAIAAGDGRGRGVDGGASADAGARDAGTRDAAASDAGTTDAPTTDAATAGGKDGGRLVDGSADAGDAEPTVEVPTFESGTRLRARILIGDDGSRHFLGWRDTKLGIDCEVSWVEDGYRCVPPLYGSTSIAFADDQCTTELHGFAPNCGPIPAYASRLAPAIRTCDGVQAATVRAVGAHAAEQYYGTPCRPYDASSQVSWHAVSALDAAIFARATLERAPLDDGLELQRFEFEDGATETFHLWHAGHHCSPLAITGAGTYCVWPWSAQGSGQQWADAECTKPIRGISVLPADCAKPDVGAWRRTDPDDSCAEVVSLVGLRRSEPTAESYRRDTAGACVKGPNPIGNVSGGVVIDPSFEHQPLPEVATVLTGKARLQASAIRTANGTQITLPQTSFYDTQLKDSCEVLPLADGTKRCVPNSDDIWVGTFGDDQCTVPVARIRDCQRSVYTSEQDARTCGAPRVVRHVYRRTASHAGPAYVVAGNRCVAISDPPEPDPPLPFAEVEALDPADLVAVSEQLE